ncbi:hypothetical protein PV682_39850 [Streptomyces niveiscabiei]|uniref:hypothetical protein n=1 Tax=Streptomyces niveiscabiei TaxID=164115 RepID=UPI0029A48043|nr:hypothetical protein [Streptomyces niveiscabiei]MDX3387555.1 hypothetical protein [Streptomyces niveiscabiei]
MGDTVSSGDSTASESADRARRAWEVYCDSHKDMIHGLIADLLHLADVDGYPGGGRYVAERAVEDYGIERFGLFEGVPLPPRTCAYVAEVLPVGYRAWVGVDEGDEPREAGASLMRLMQAAELATGELGGFLEDMARGECVTADDGTVFRVRRNPFHLAARVAPTS